MNKKNLHRIGFLLVVALGLTLALSACTAAQADRLATPTRTVPALDAADDSAAIEQAMLDSLRAQGAPTENARIEVQKIADGYARVHVYYDVVKQPGVWDQGFAYLEDGAWKAWAFGSGIAQEHVEAAGIPRSVWPEGWLSPDAGDDNAAIEQAMLDSMKEKGAPTENARIEVQKVADGYARVHVYYDVVNQPGVWDQGFAYLEDGTWKAWAFGSGIAQEHVEAAGIPRSVWPEGWLAAAPEGDNCPETTVDTRLLKNRKHGYCLLYPVGYKVEKPSDIATALVVGSLLNSEDPRVDIVAEDAGGRTADDLAKQIAADFEGFPIERSSVVLGGVEAIVLDKLPGQDINRRVLFEHDGLLYQLTFWPADESAGDVYRRMETLYDTIVASFTFIPRSNEWVLGEDCLEAKADEQLLFAGRHNFCVLYPIGYEVAQPAENELVFSAGSLQDVTRPKLFIGIEDAAGRTADQVANELLAVVSCPYGGPECQRIFGLWAGYEPAEVLDNMPGQEISRQVIVVHDGRLFVLKFVPADPQAGDVYAQMESLYTMVIDSFRFLR